MFGRFCPVHTRASSTVAAVMSQKRLCSRDTSGSTMSSVQMLTYSMNPVLAVTVIAQCKALPLTIGMVDGME